MTALSPAPGPAVLPAGQGARVPWTGLLAAEWTKIRSVRSTIWTLAVFVVIAVGFSSLVAVIIASQWDKPGDHPEHAQIAADPAGFIFGPGLFLGQLALSVLGVIVITSEYSTGAIRSSLLAVPLRVPMLAAKAVVFAAVEIVVSAVSVFAVLFIATAIYHGHFAISLSHPGMVRATLGTVGYLTVLGLFALAIGGLIRHTAGAIATVIGLVLVVPILVGLIPGRVGDHIHAYLPTVAGQFFTRVAQQPGDLLSPWQGFGVFCLWTAVLLAVSGWLLVRRDA